MENAAADSMTARVLLVALVLGVVLAPWTVALSDPAALIAPYLRTRDDKAVGQVLAHAIGDGPRPSAAPTPYDGVSVMLLPESPDLQAELDAIRAHARDSLKHYMDATSDVTDARQEYERTLLAAGGGELIRGEVSDATGLARLGDVPEGSWLLLAWRSHWQPAKPPKLRKEDTAAFREITVAGSYSIITYWLMPVSVRAGTVTEVELNDRNVWMTGVREDVRRIEGTPKKGSKKQR
jgi:hypothetical protein